MSRPVDVLAILDAAIEGIGGPTDLGLTEARAAVAELVDALDEAKGDMEQAAHWLESKAGGAESSRGSSIKLLNISAGKLTAALAKFGGAA